MNWLKARAGEYSTWVGIAGLIASGGLIVVKDK